MVNIGFMIAGILGAVVGIFLLAPSTYVGTVWSDVSSWGCRSIPHGFVEAVDPPNDLKICYQKANMNFFK